MTSNKRKRRENSDLLETAERRAFVFQLRRAGVQYREIAKRAIEKFGVDRLPLGFNGLYAAKDISRELTRLRDEIAESAQDVRQMQDERLNDMLVSLWPQAMRGHRGAIDRVLRIMDRRAKLWGLDKQKPSDTPPINITFDVGAWASQRQSRLDEIEQLDDNEATD